MSTEEQVTSHSSTSLSIVADKLTEVYRSCCDLWSQLGLPEEEIHERKHTFFTQLLLNCDDFQERQKRYKQQIENAVKEQTEQLTMLAALLEEDPPSIQEYDRPYLALDAISRASASIVDRVEERRRIIFHLYDQYHALCVGLDQVPMLTRETAANDLSQSGEDALRDELTRMQEISLPILAGMARDADRINQLCQRMERDLDGILDIPAIRQSLGSNPQPRHAAELHSLVADLEREAVSRENAAAQHLEALEALCRQTGTEMPVFSGISDASLSAMADSVLELREERRRRLPGLCQEKREKAEAIITKTRLSLDHVVPLATGEDEEALISLEKAVQRLEAINHAHRPILAMADRLDELKEVRERYDTIRADPTRLTGRSREASKLLREEEKLRTRLQRELPRVLATLYARLERWEPSPALLGDRIPESVPLFPCGDRDLLAEVTEAAEMDVQVAKRFALQLQRVAPGIKPPASRMTSSRSSIIRSPIRSREDTPAKGRAGRRPASVRGPRTSRQPKKRSLPRPGTVGAPRTPSRTPISAIKNRFKRTALE
eukprot:gnl/Dysnectes_brevis/907_a1008_1763.p1 GENE.gnl/Dysnectes_brevis/907_a1008_1763~~gnl/Dysnectes_brevis/907_a1008_1763.p1  ORF type:complete len:551 (+),score=162.17 gnl/Dysnectes_brevis/907_a1008_1763:837-2489(+)